MDHIVYLDYKAKELDNLKSGDKTMIIRGAMGRKIPYGRVKVGDVLYFAENKGDGLIKAKALVGGLTQTDKLTKEESEGLVNSHQNELRLNAAMMKRFAGKRFLVFINIKEFKMIEPFEFDRSKFVNMDDWLLVEKIQNAF